MFCQSESFKREWGNRRNCIYRKGCFKRTALPTFISKPKFGGKGRRIQHRIAIGCTFYCTGHYKNGKTGGTLKKSWQAERTTVSGSTVKGGIYTALEYAPYVEFGHRTRLGKGTSPKYKPKKNGKAWVEGKKYLNTVVPKVERDAPKILMQKMEEVLKWHQK